MVDDYPILTVLPPVIAIALVLITKRVLLSLGSGVVASALLVAGFNPLETLSLVWNAFRVIFWDEGAVNTYYVFILVFTLLLGIIAALIMMSGGTRAFSDWAVERIHTRRGAKILPAVLGIVIFIDDYFNALAVGQVARPVTDKHNVSRAKLAYVVDSTSAPVAVLAPFSSWGASIIGIMAPIVASSALVVSDVEAFLGAAAMNYYAIVAVLMVWVTVMLHVEIGPMRTEERRAITAGRTFNPDEIIPGELAEDLPVHHPGSKRALIIPFVLLVVGVLGGIIWTGYQGGGSWDVLSIFANTDVSLSLLWGGGLGLAAALYYYLRYTTANPKFSPSTLGLGFWEGIKSMMPAVSILLLAWMLGDLIGQLGTGQYLGDLVNHAAVPPAWLIPLMFCLAGAMAFSTGTSWGSFGLLLPIAGQIMNSVDGGAELLLPAFGAVLAGAVFGDHCSPISDTTILSSTGSGANVMTHVTTQLPYALVSAAIALLGYVVFALTINGLVGLLATLGFLALGALAAKTLLTPLEEEIPTEEQAERVQA
ncbi:Na+/H+ antiporter NhaC family protein [Ornithinimicrobium sp. F0845]|uniref:Na+/H+ antiporter NhaC family protein n=1 Tax=Ornithinimicrobium sp. F0845 TaxID=2926412 RepID=UPI001FF136B2|nr:Na+/H+ antiporter NhaC family protein [Ornithinimicrobium sp. F0845]MCK0113355.1 Na+/H+ antiporter NhaC family protein [Ornithinimicrobium sp. F0845]